jgi:hypothetical protein
MIITNWREAWRMASIWVAGAAVAFGALPTDTQAAMLGMVGLEPSRIPAVIGVLVIVARLVKQPSIEGKS